MFIDLRKVCRESSYAIMLDTAFLLTRRQLLQQTQGFTVGLWNHQRRCDARIPENWRGPKCGLGWGRVIQQK